MPRLQINLTGPGARVGSTWTVTSNWAVSALPADVGALSTILTTAMNTLRASTPFKAGIGTNYTCQKLHGLAYPVPTGPASFVADSSGAAFTGAGPAPMPPLAVVVSERTSAAGPSFRGRSYWPLAPLTTDGSVAASVQTTIRASWRAFHDAILAALAGASLSPVHVVYSPKTGNMTPITAICTGDRVDTARGRFGDSVEGYVCETVPTGQALQVAPEEVGLPPDITPEEFQDILNNLNLGSWEGVDLGPLKQAAQAFKMYLEARSG